MFVKKQGISPEVFYGNQNAQQEKIKAIIKNCDNHENLQQPKFMARLLGPSTTWRIFKKQQDAINCCLLRRNGLMTFAFEDINARRMFLAAHPKVFWYFNYHRFFKNCNSYEIIKEYAACKLYLDIEFEYTYNNQKNGERMLNNMLDVINFNLKKYFNIICTRKEALDLDSSTDSKFSHHVIYEIKNVAFQHNYAVGNFVRKICSELKEAFESNLMGDNTKLQGIAEKYNLSQRDILELFIKDQKGKVKLFIDEGVYTKNRHFRLLGSSKKARNIPLRISNNNEYTPNEQYDLEYFLDSLVTYFSWDVERVLEFGELSIFKPCKTMQHPKLGMQCMESYLFPQLDSFIDSLILPHGRIRKKVFFSDSSTVVYDIQGFRYCHNIKREHKSNNIKFIVDLKTLTFYQKCYDPDCLHFRSHLQHLPDEIGFLFESNHLYANKRQSFSKEFIINVEQKKDGITFEQNVSEEDLDRIADCAESMLDIEW